MKENRKDWKDWDCRLILSFKSDVLWHHQMWSPVIGQIRCEREVRQDCDFLNFLQRALSWAERLLTAIFFILCAYFMSEMRV